MSKKNISEDFVAQFRAAHDIAGNAALKELEVPINCRFHLLHALFGHFAHVGGDFERWCRAHSALRSTEKNLLRVPAKATVHSDVKSATEAGIRDEAGSLPRGQHDVTETRMRVTVAFAAGGHRVSLSS